MDKRANSQSIGVIAVMIVITCVVAYYSLRPAQHQALPPLTIKDAPPAAATIPTKLVADEDARSASSQSAQSSNTSAAQEIVVHVAGAVFRPDVYRLPIGSRVNDAIRAAGGATQYADTNAINLAAPVQDGSKIYVPEYGEQSAQQPAQPSQSSGTTVSNAPQQTNPQTPPGQSDSAVQTADSNQPQASGKLTDPGQGSVNINTASADELQRLPGIGPAIAQKIIDYRQANGLFKNAEDLKNVSGIGDKKYAKLAAFITVG